VRLATLVAGLVGVLASADLHAQTSWPADFVSRDAIERTHAAQRDALYSCYVTHVGAASREHGDVVKLRVTVTESGKAFRVDFLESSYTSKAFEACVRERFVNLDYGLKAAKKTVFVQTLGFENGKHKLKFGVPQPAGGAITQESVVHMAAQRRAEVQKCYTDALSTQPGLRGQLLIELVIDGATGRPRSTRVVKSTLSSAPVEQCVLRVIERFAFPLPEDRGLVIVQFPLTFDSE